MSAALVVNEIYLSVQGESTFAGLPCIFIRLTACNLRCSYCDTAYAFTEGKKIPLEKVLSEVQRLAAPFRDRGISSQNLPAIDKHDGAGRADLRLPLVELTGGEPLLQTDSIPLMKSLCDAGFTVLVETSGAIDISSVDQRVHRIMDLKCPSSGEVRRNRWQNLEHLRSTDEIKFVIGTREDYHWAKEQLGSHSLASICPVLVSWVSPLLPHQQDTSLKNIPREQTPLSRRELVEAILADALPVRFQLQMHKFIWPPDQKGV